MKTFLKTNGSRNVTEPRSLSEFIKEFLNTDHPLAVALRCTEVGKLSNGPTADTSTPLEDWIDSGTAIDMLNISERTLQKWRSDGTMPFSKLGNHCYYRRSDIEQMLEAGYINRTKKGGCNER